MRQYQARVFQFHNRSLAQTFTVNPPLPTVMSVGPTLGVRGASVTVTLKSAPIFRSCQTRSGTNSSRCCDASKRACQRYHRRSCPTWCPVSTRVLMTRRHASMMALVSFMGWRSLARAQVTRGAAPTTKAAVGPFGAAIVKRAESLLPSPQRWNRVDTGDCPRSDTTYTIRCALRRAVVEAARLSWNPSAVAPSSQLSAARVDCSIDVSADHSGGSCGTLWDELPVFILARAKAITSGAWRKDAQPMEVWTGTMADAESPVKYESRHGVTMVSQRQSSDQLIDFNNDSTTTFDDVRRYFRALEDRVLQEGATDLDRVADQVEIEIYQAGNGVIRTYNGWFPVSGFSARGSTIRFRIDTTKEIAPNALDREILMRAAKIISSDSVWN